MSPPSAASAAADFAYELPSQLIARTPATERDHSRLLSLGAGGIEHLRFDSLPALLAPGDLLVVNDTRVLKARLAAVKDSGGAASMLVERLESEHTALVQVRVSKPLRPGRRLQLADGSGIEVVERVGEFYRLRFANPVAEVLERLGTVPLPPYLEREALAADEDRYQTVYGTQPGAVAAPTAGLHFTPGLLEQIEGQGARIARVTLHVGAGTFQPLRVERVEDHVMHAERCCVPEATAQAVAQTRAAGGRVVAVGTTVVRTLEAASTTAGVTPGWQETRLFIRPGFRFRSVDALVTNFHLPESTLLMLVCAFGGYDRVLAAYREAVARRYRFFSYGDAMFLERADDV